VLALWQAFDDTRWDDAVALLAPDVVITMPDSGRVLTGRTAVHDFNAGYPGRTRCTVLGIHAAPDGTVVARVEAVNDRLGRFWCIGFYTLADQLISHGLEYWVSDESATITPD